GPEDSALGVLGESDGRMGLGSCLEGGLWARVERGRLNGRRFFGIVTQLLGKSSPEGLVVFLGRPSSCGSTEGREEGPRSDANGGRLEVDSPRRGIGRTG